MSAHADRIRLLLGQGPVSVRHLVEKSGLSQPTLSRALSSMDADVIRMRSSKSIQYVIRDTARGLGDIPIHRVGEDGKLRYLGTLVAVRPEGFVMHKADGQCLHSDGLPWWLLDMRPQGFLGRAYASRHADALGLPASLSEWSDAQILRALLTHGHDAVGNLLLGHVARDHFLNAPTPTPIPESAKGETFVRMAREAASGSVPGSSAGGEQPKFAAFVASAHGPCHALVKFTLPDVNPVTARWRDLLLAEHIALETLAAAGLPAARTCVIDHGRQRFLQIERFDRVGVMGRRAVFSLASVEAEFVGAANAPWPTLTARLAKEGVITPQCADSAALLYAFGALTGNTDMHPGNLAFVSDSARPYALAPAYDMLPMGFAPQSGGSLPDSLAPATLHAGVSNQAWMRALALATVFLARVRAERRFTRGFRPCIDALARHCASAEAKISRLG